jgi:hypothetical protein
MLVDVIVCETKEMCLYRKLFACFKLFYVYVLINKIVLVMLIRCAL